MTRFILLAFAAGTLVAAAPVKLAPADDPVALVGAAARDKHGIEPLTRPADDLGMMEDPAEAAVKPVQTTPERRPGPPTPPTHR